jgi:hypothetical protein
MRATTSLEFAKLVQCVEESLVKLCYHYLKNRTNRITEFEIDSPCHFRVLVEEQREERFGRFTLLRSEKNESTIEVFRTLGSTDSDDVLKQHLSAFVEQLGKTLPEEPWKGLGPLRSRSERENWSKLSELRSV